MSLGDSKNKGYLLQDMEIYLAHSFLQKGRYYLAQCTQYIYEDSKLLASLMLWYRYLFPSLLFWCKNQVYCACSAQMAHKLESSGSAY